MLIHHGRSPFATVPKRQKPRENGGNGTAAIKVQPNQGPGGCNGMGSNANSTARNDKEGSYVENEALVGRGAEGETTAETDAPQQHEHRRRGRKRARHLRGRRHGHLLLRRWRGRPEFGSLPATRPGRLRYLSQPTISCQ